MSKNTVFFNMLSRVANKELTPDKPSGVIQEIIRTGALTKQQIAKELGVQESQLHRVSGTLKPRQVRELCVLALSAQQAAPAPKL